MDAGVYESRSEAVRAGLVAVVDQQRRAALGQAIVDGYRRVPQAGDDLDWPDSAGAAMIAEDKRRPVLVVTRTDAAAVLNRLAIAPVTRTVRGIPTEIVLGPEQGLADECVASFDNLQPISRRLLTQRAGALDLHSREICRALAAMADC